MSDAQTIAADVQPLDLAPIEGRIDAIPPEDWTIDWESCDCGGDYPCGHGSYAIKIGPILIETIDSPAHVAIAEFIGNALKDVTDLAAEVRRLRGHITAVTDAARARDKQLLDLRDNGRTRNRTQTRGHAWEEAAHEVRKIADALDQSGAKFALLSEVLRLRRELAALRTPPDTTNRAYLENLCETLTGVLAGAATANATAGERARAVMPFVSAAIWLVERERDQASKDAQAEIARLNALVAEADRNGSGSADVRLGDAFDSAAKAKGA